MVKKTFFYSGSRLDENKNKFMLEETINYIKVFERLLTQLGFEFLQDTASLHCRRFPFEVNEVYKITTIMTSPFVCIKQNKLSSSLPALLVSLISFISRQDSPGIGY